MSSATSTVAGTVGVRAMTFADLWDQAVDTHGGDDFLIFSDDTGVGRWSYAEFEECVTRVAVTFRDHGVVHGSAVHVALRNCPAFVAIWMACARIGAWMVPVDPGSTAGDIADQMSRTRPSLGLCGRDRAEVYSRGATGIDLPIIQLRETADDLRGGPLVTARRSTTAERDVSIVPSDRLAVMFTSGTTSRPKGVVLTQQNYATVARVMSEVISLGPESRWLVTLPLFHANAQYYCFAPAIAVGASVALTDRFSASSWCRQATELGVTHGSLFAAPVRMILARNPESSPRPELEHVWFAQNLTEAQYSQFSDLVGCLPRQLYGMTETVAAVTADTGEPFRHDVMGTAIGGREVCIIDPVTGDLVEDDQPGLLLISGTPGVDLFLEYLDDPEATRRAFTRRQGTDWFVTGDLVSRAPSGAMAFVGRADDMVKVSGENVSLARIESLAGDAPGVFEVAVVAEPDPVRDNVPVAYFVPAVPSSPPAEAELVAWATEHLAPASRPRAWRPVDALPKTSVGKVRRFALTSTTPAASAVEERSDT